MNLINKSVLITGGTGSFGKMFTRLILERNPNIKSLLYYQEMNKSISNGSWNFLKTSILQSDILLEMLEIRSFRKSFRRI